MTREEAIKMLEYIRHTGNGESEYKNCAQAVALDVAIKVLEQEACDDCISRKTAKEKAWNLCLETGFDNEKVVEMLDDLPSIRPTQKWIPVSERLL